MDDTKNFKVSYQHRKLINFTCDNCGKEGTKPLSEYNRNLKLGRKNFCCQSCAAIYNNKNNKRVYTEEEKARIKSYSANRRDDYTPFRYSLRCAKRRYKDVDIDLEYLKEIWELQKGICPYTNIHLTLPEDGNIKTLQIEERASLDRIDSSKGYIKGNIQFVSTPINYMKNIMSDSETKSFLKRISSYTSTFVEDLTISSPL